MTDLTAITARDRSDIEQQLVSDAALLADDTNDSSRVVGYVIMAMYSDGTGRTGGSRPSPADHKIGSALWEAWAKQSLEAHFAYKEGVDAAYAVLNGEA